MQQTIRVILSAIALASCDGNGSFTPPPPPPPDTSVPNVSFSPATLTVESAMTGSSTLSATDNVGVTSGPTVSCTNGGAFDTGSNTFTAATVAGDTTSICTATAGDAAGNSGTGTLTVTMTPPPDSVAPVVEFTPATLTVISDRMGAAVVTASDDVDGTLTPIVTCTNGGTFDLSQGIFTAPAVAGSVTSVCTATAMDAAGNEGAGILTVAVPPNMVPAASATSNITTVMEGQPFMLDASSSSDGDGDVLTYNWTQTAGAPVTITDPSMAIQHLTAPDLSEPETLKFNVAVSDGYDTRIKTVSIFAVHIKAPLNPIFEPYGNIHALHDSDLHGSHSGGYTMHVGRFHRPSLSEVLRERYDIVQAQFYTAFGVEEIGYGYTYTHNSAVALYPYSYRHPVYPEIEAVEFIDMVFSGDRRYHVIRHYYKYVDTEISFTTLRNSVGSKGSHRTGNGDKFSTWINPIISLITQDSVPIGTNQLLTVATGNSGGHDFTVTSFIVEPNNGRAVQTELVAPSADIKTGVTLSKFTDDSYVAIWEQYSPGDVDIDIYMQRATSTGAPVGDNVILNETVTGIKSDLDSASMLGGNVFVVWTDGNLSSPNDILIKARIIRPDGTFTTGEFPINNSGNCTQVLPRVTALKTNQVLVTWGCSIMGTVNEIRALVYNVDGSTGSNEFIIAPYEVSANYGKTFSATLEDNRVVIGFSDQTSDKIYTVGLWPVGK